MQVMQVMYLPSIEASSKTSLGDFMVSRLAPGRSSDLLPQGRVHPAAEPGLCLGLSYIVVFNSKLYVPVCQGKYLFPYWAGPVIGKKVRERCSDRSHDRNLLQIGPIEDGSGQIVQGCEGLE